jgi:hypothetical protein
MEQFMQAGGMRRDIDLFWIVTMTWLSFLLMMVSGSRFGREGLTLRTKPWSVIEKQ